MTKKWEFNYGISIAISNGQINISNDFLKISPNPYQIFIKSDDQITLLTRTRVLNSFEFIYPSFFNYNIPSVYIDNIGLKIRNTENYSYLYLIIDDIVMYIESDRICFKTKIDNDWRETRAFLTIQDINEQLQG